MSLAEILPQRPRDAEEVRPDGRPERDLPREAAADDAAVPLILPPRAAVAPRRSLVSAGLVGALCGGVAAIAAMWAWTSLVPAVDPRLDGLAQRVELIDGDLRSVAQGLAPIQAELARFYDVAAELSGRIDTTSAESAALIEGIRQTLADQAAFLAVGSPVFAVAALQLHQAALSGAPFETELLNAYALAGDDAEVAAALGALVGPSRQGLPDLPALRGGLANAASQAGLGYGDDVSYLDVGLSLFSYVGLSTESYASERARTLLAEADAALARGDLAAARESVGAIDRSIAPAFSLWIEAADTRLAAEAALADIAALVHANLSGRLVAGPAVVGGG